MRYELKEAIIVQGRTIDTADQGPQVNGGFPLGNMFQCRVLPEMNDIQEIDLLPVYPNFFKESQIAYQPDDRVWLFCTEDFQAGFILGRTQGASGSEVTGFIHEINTAESNAGMELSGYNQLTIEGGTGSSLRFVNERTGQSGVIYNNKTIYLYGPKGEIWINNPGMKAYVSPEGNFSISGKALSQTFTSNVSSISQGASTEQAISKRINTSGAMTLSAGGSRQDTVGSNKNEMVMGDSQEVVTGKKSVITGGSYSLFVGPAGDITITSSTNIIITSTLGLIINGPLIGSPAGTIIPNGTGGFCALHFDPFSGAPLTTNIYPGV